MKDQPDKVLDTIVNVLSDNNAANDTTFFTDINFIEHLQSIDSSLNIISNNLGGTFWDNAGVIALITFLLGLVGTAITYIISQYKKRNSIRLTIITWLEGNESRFNQYADCLKTLYESIENTDEVLPQPYITNQFSVKRIDEFNINELNDALVQNLKGAESKDEKSKQLFRLLSDVEYLGGVQPYIKDYYNNYNSYTRTLIERWNHSFIDFRQFMNEAPPQNINPKEELFMQNLYTELNNFIENSMQDEGNLLFSRIETFISGILSVIGRENLWTPLYHRASGYVFSITEVYANIKKNKETYIILKQYYERLKGNLAVGENMQEQTGVINSLSNCKDFYKNHKINWW